MLYKQDQGLLGREEDYKNSERSIGSYIKRTHNTAKLQAKDKQRERYSQSITKNSEDI